MSTTEKPEYFDNAEHHRIREQARLLSIARRYETLQDPNSPGGYIVRDPDLENPVEHVNALRQCTCPAFGRWGHCGHVAIIELRYG